MDVDGDDADRARLPVPAESMLSALAPGTPLHPQTPPTQQAHAHLDDGEDVDADAAAGSSSPDARPVNACTPVDLNRCNNRRPKASGAARVDRAPAPAADSSTTPRDDEVEAIE